MEKIIEKIRGAVAGRGMIPVGCARVAVGVSGGADSVCLLHALFELRGDLGVELCVAHLNHGIRGAEADGDEEFVRALAEGLGLEFCSEKIDIPSLHVSGGPSLEQVCRRERHEFFKRALQKLGADRLATAHTRSDQAETALMRVVRGTSLRGLGGMGYVSGNIVRPMLDVSRDEVLEFLAARGLEFREDATNADEGYIRNRVRHSLLPFLREKFNPRVEERLFSLAELARVDSDFIEREADAVYLSAVCGGGETGVGFGVEAGGDCEGDVRLSMEKIEDLHDAVLSRVLARGYYERAGDDSFSTLTALHIKEMMTAARGGEAGAVVCLPGGVEMLRDYGAVVFRAAKRAGPPMKDYSYVVGLPAAGEKGKIVVPEAGVEIELWIEDGERDEMFANSDERTAFLSLKALSGELTIRNWRDGDCFVPLGLRGGKKVQDYFTDEKVRAEDRRGWPLLFCGGEVAWVVGRRVDDRFKVARGGGRVLCLRAVFAEGAGRRE